MRTQVGEVEVQEARAGRIRAQLGQDLIGIARARIVETAAALFHRHGARDTTKEDIRRAANISGSQLDLYFPARRDLLHAVLRYRIDSAADPDRVPGLDRPGTMDAWRQWAADVVSQRESDSGAACWVRWPPKRSRRAWRWTS